MSTEPRLCTECGVAIPAARLEALPSTFLCVECSKAVGGEFFLEVTTSSTGKAGSLKKTGLDVVVTRKRKPGR
jgi:hypothetical protein